MLTLIPTATLALGIGADVTRDTQRSAGATPVVARAGAQLGGRLRAVLVGPALHAAVAVDDRFSLVDRIEPLEGHGRNGLDGTVTLTAAPPSCGAVIALSSSSAAATVPQSVTVVAGATAATFTTTTTSVTAVTAVTISATYAGTTRTAMLTVNPAEQSAKLTVTATGRSGERVLSNPAGINVSVGGTTGTASFSVGTSVTLSMSNGRDAIWSGACSSGGRKQRTCTFTVNGDAAVTANVQ